MMAFIMRKSEQDALNDFINLIGGTIRFYIARSYDFLLSKKRQYDKNDFIIPVDEMKIT